VSDFLCPRKIDNPDGLTFTPMVTAAQTTIVGEVNANEVKIDAVKADTAAIKAKTVRIQTL
jgi:hypothetical protein